MVHRDNTAVQGKSKTFVLLVLLRLRSTYRSLSCRWRVTHTRHNPIAEFWTRIHQVIYERL